MNLIKATFAGSGNYFFLKLFSFFTIFITVLKLF